MSKRKLTISKGDQVVAILTGDRLEVANMLSLEGAAVYQLVSLGVPVSREDPGVRYEFWRVQVNDPDFAVALTEHLKQFDLTVEQA
jgi:hypothetical protein